MQSSHSFCAALLALLSLHVLCVFEGGQRIAAQPLHPISFPCCLQEMLPHVAFWHAVPVRCMVCFSGAMGFIAERLFGVGYQQVSVLDDDDDDMFEDDDDNTYL